MCITIHTVVVKNGVIGVGVGLLFVMAACSAHDQQAASEEASADRQGREASPVYYYNPVWSPDGSAIAFYSNRDGNYEIYTIHPDGTGLTRLTHNEAGDSEMTWSPDGAQIAFTSGRDGPSAVFVMNADGSALTRLSDTTRVGAPAWSPDGTKIAYEGRVDGNRDILVINTDDAAVTRLTEDPGNDFSPTWSPDGSQIAFASNRAGTYDLYVMNADGSNQRPLTTAQTHEVKPDWSPDGGWLLFSMIGEQEQGLGLYTLNLADGTLARVVKNSEQDTAASWSPDGTRVAYLADLEGGMGLMVSDADGSNPTRVIAATTPSRTNPEDAR